MVKRDPNALYCDEPSMTKQSFVDECDINQIIDRARNGGSVDHLNARVPVYADVSNIPDYRSALDVVREADASFMALDAKVRERFANDPGRLLDFLKDPQNYDEGVKLGLLTPKKPVAPVSPPNAPLPPDLGGETPSQGSGSGS